MALSLCLIAGRIHSAISDGYTILTTTGGVLLEDLGEVYRLGAQAVDVGRAILDAPLLDLRLCIID